MDPTEALPVGPTAPAAAPAAPGAGGPPAQPGPAAAAAGPPPAPSRAKMFFGNIWRKLTSPTPHVPAEYTGRRLARFSNELVDGRGQQGPAAQALWGESVALVVDHAMAARGGAQTPLGHLGGSTMELAWIVWDTAPQRAAAAAQASAEASQAAQDRAGDNASKD